jgi:elongation factor P--beta-lysine ligase
MRNFINIINHQILKDEEIKEVEMGGAYRPIAHLKEVHRTFRSENLNGKKKHLENVRVDETIISQVKDRM